MDIEIRICYISCIIQKKHRQIQESHTRDLKKYVNFWKERGIRIIKMYKRLRLEGYISYMEREKFASSSFSSDCFYEHFFSILCGRRRDRRRSGR